MKGFSKFAALVAGALISTSVFAADLSGTWKMNVQSSMGAGTPTFVLQQDGNNVTGKYSGQLGESDVTGTVDGDSFKLTYTVSGGGQSLDVVYAGTVEGDNVKGEVNMGDLGQATFTGTKE